MVFFCHWPIMIIYKNIIIMYLNVVLYVWILILNRFFIWIMADQNAMMNHGRLVIIPIPLYLFFAAFAKFVFSEVKKKFKKLGDIVWVRYLCIFSFLIDLHVLIYINLALTSCVNPLPSLTKYATRGEQKQ